MNKIQGRNQDIFADFRQERIDELFCDDFEFILSQHPPRPYQRKIMSRTISDMKDWIHAGRWDVAVWWWKTFMALSLMKHIVDRWWRVLFITPDNTSLNNALESHVDKYMLWGSNLIQFSNESDITGITNPKEEKFYSTVPYHYSTAQMLTYNERFKKIPPDYYDLIVYEEPQWLMWDALSLPQQHFLGMGIFMSATPYNNSKHLWNTVPHVYGEISSEYLIKYHKFPKWKVKNYHVDEWDEDIDIKNVDKDDTSDFNFEKENHNCLLNINERFLIIESIFEEIIISWDRKWLAFMPSVRDAEFFVKYIVPHNPILKWKIDFVSWSRSKQENKDVENRLRSWELKVVLSKDIWNQAIDIDDITDIILNDPTRSLQRLIQRIGRWARPSKWKNELLIHDLLSSFFHSENVWLPAVRADNFIPQKSKKSTKSRWLRYSEEVDPSFIAALHQRRVEKLVGVTEHELEFREEVRNAYFLSDKELAVQTFLHFALQVFHIHPQHLANNIESFTSYKQFLEVTFMDKNIILFFWEFIEILKFYWVLWHVLRQDYTCDDTLHDSVMLLQDEFIQKVEERLSQNEEKSGKLSLYQWKPNPQDTSKLSAIINERNGVITWEEKKYQAHKAEPPYFSYNVDIQIWDKNIRYTVWKWSNSKKNAKHFISKDILDRFFNTGVQSDNSWEMKNYISQLNEFIQKKWWKVKYGRLIWDDSQWFRYSHLVITIWDREYEIEDEAYSNTKKWAKENISKIALDSLKDGDLKSKKTLQTNIKSHISLIYELITAHGGSVEFIFHEDSSKRGYYHWVLVWKIWDQEIIDKTENSFSESEAKEEVARSVYKRIKSLFPPLEEFTWYQTSHIEQLKDIHTRIEQGENFTPEDIILMRKLKPWSTPFDYRWALWFLERKWVIWKVTISWSYRATLVQINGTTIWAASRKDRTKDRKYYREIACRTVLEKLLKIEEIKLFYLAKLNKQIQKASLVASC